MSSSDFQLTNQDAPVFQKSDQKAFLPTPKAQVIRQQVYSELSKSPESTLTIQELIKATGRPYKAIYAASKALVKTGFATRHKVRVDKPTKKNPDNFEFRVGLKYVQPWVGTINKKW